MGGGGGESVQMQKLVKVLSCGTDQLRFIVQSRGLLVRMISMMTQSTKLSFYLFILFFSEFCQLKLSV